MLIFNTTTNSFVIDPHYLTINCFKVIWAQDKSKNKEIATAKLMWIYHMYNPHSPFRDYRISEKSKSIIEATFPKYYLEVKARECMARLQAIIDKNAEIEKNNRIFDEMQQELGGRPEKSMKKDLLDVPETIEYDPAEESNMPAAIEWYKENHLKHTPLWNAVSAYDEAMYNLADIVRNKTSTASEIKTASAELDDIPKKREKMRQQAIKDEAQTLKTSGDKNIKRGEMLPQQKARKLTMT